MMLKLTQELFGGQDPSQSRGVEVSDGLGGLMDFFNYFSGVVEDRKKNPTDDLASLLANALVDGEPMETLDQISYFIITATAGKSGRSKGAEKAQFKKGSLKRAPNCWIETFEYLRKGRSTGVILKIIFTSLAD